MSNNVWLNRTKDRLTEFKEQSIIAIGWSKTGDLTGKDMNGIEERLADPQSYAYESLKLGNSKASVNIFVNRMQKGDLVLVPQGAEILIARIESDYFFDKTKVQDDYPHQRKVKWLKTILRDDLPKSARGSLKVHRTVADLSKHYPAIKALSEGKEVQEIEEDEAETTITVPYRLRPNVDVTLIVPNDITKEEAARVSDFARTIYYAD